MPTLSTLWKQLTSCEGTARRREFWVISLALTFMTIAIIPAIWFLSVAEAYGVDMLISGGLGLAAATIGYVALMIPVSLRRCRDAGLSQKTYFYVLGASVVLSIITLSTFLSMLAWTAMWFWLAFAPAGYLNRKS